MNSADTSTPTQSADADQQQQKHKIDPITAVQDSIDSLALSLFEALRGVRDAVAPESLETPGGNVTSATPPVVPLSAFKDKDDTEDIETLGKNATATQLLLHGLNTDYFPPRAFDLLEPDYDSFIMTYLNDNPYAKELVERVAALQNEEKKADSGDSSKDNNEVAAEAKTEIEKPKETENKPAKAASGEVGYEFRKKFILDGVEEKWYTGKVIEIIPPTENGKTRRCAYTDGDIEDLAMDDLDQLAKLDPNNNKPKPRLSIKLNSKSDSKEVDNTPSEKYVVNFPLTQEKYTKLLLDTEHQRDVQTTQNLAQDILTKSAEVNDLVSKLPGMDRTRDMQMELINKLIQENHKVGKELEDAYVVANKRREEVRAALSESTCLALGVDEEDE